MIRSPTVLLLGFAAACQSPLADCDAETSVLGTWRYSGVQDAPAPLHLSGILEVTSESCEGFQGRIDLVETSDLGESHRRAGPVAGRITSAGSIRFDAFLASLPRQHAGALSAGRVEGTWLLPGSGSAPTVTGHFVAEWESTP